MTILTVPNDGKELRKRLRSVPTTLREANAFVARHHRHRGVVRGCKFALAVAPEDEDLVVGVALVGRPVSRVLDDGWTLEVNRLCTDGTPNAPSALYGASWRVARELGYRRVITYTRATEPGTSLYGAGWTLVGERPGGGNWDRTNRPRVPIESEDKQIWERS